MENEDDFNYGIYGQPAIISRVVDRLGELGHYGTSGNAIDPNDFESPHNKEISIPETFKDVLLKLCPEIKDVVSIGYRENAVYDPNTFNPIYKYLVGVDIYFDNHYGMKKSKHEYGTLFNDYFKMTYSDIDYVTFHVQSFIFPPEKSNREKFLELFETK
jgi:hypothetical protein